MDSSDLFLTFFIFFVFLFLYIFNIFYVKYKEIKRNWPRYKCQPMIMPFANFFGHNVNDNFVSCIGNMQGGLMKQFLAPLMKNMDVITSVGEGLSDDLLNVASMGGNLKLDQLSSFGDMTNVMGGFSRFMTTFTSGLENITNQVVKIANTVTEMGIVSAKLGGQIAKSPVKWLASVA